MTIRSEGYVHVDLNNSFTDHSRRFDWRSDLPLFLGKETPEKAGSFPGADGSREADRPDLRH